MTKLNKKIVCLLLILTFLLTGVPIELKSFAAPMPISLTIEYNSITYKYDISFPIDTEPAETIVRFHDKNGTENVLYNEHTTIGGRVTISTDFEADHIYDISVDVIRKAGDPQPSYRAETYFLADITFTGESFNQMAKMGDIEDLHPDLEPNIPGQAIVVRSGIEPVIKLNWKIPTIYDKSSTESAQKDKVINLTDSKALKLLQLADVPIAKACFQINMTVGQSSARQLNFNTDYDSENNMIIEGEKDSANKNLVVTGFKEGKITDTNNTVSITLKQENNIEPGTEYAFTNIGIIFENDKSEQITLRRTKFATGEGNRFAVKNIDNAFKDTSYNLSSIYTPIPMELRKVDADKVEIRFKKIVNGLYPELHYQVQYSSRIDDFYDFNNRWVKIPASSLPNTDDYGSEIVTINIAGNTHPEFYFRVVYYDSASDFPRSSSLVIDLRNLGIELGKPPLPKEIQVQPIYSGRWEGVSIPSTDLSSGQVEIPGNDLQMSFEKPISWRQYTNSDGSDGWNKFKSMSPGNADYIFHILLSAYLPESKVEEGTTTIGLQEQKEIYLPTKQKRVLVVGKEHFIEDPNDPNRIICDIRLNDGAVPAIPGRQLFYDYVGYWDEDKNEWIKRDLMNENNENVDGGPDTAAGDYPNFLVPNTAYYMQVFTSRREDNEAIYKDLWADGLDVELNNRLSYKSPVISFTTWPLTETPVPMPDIKLDIEPEIFINPKTGEIKLEGIRVDYPRVLTDIEWQRYTSETENRAVRYELFISRDPLNFDEKPNIVDEARYPEEAEEMQRGKTFYTDNKGKPILPNTVYYIKAKATLVIINGNPDDPNNPDPNDPPDEFLGSSVDTAIKAITTPKIDDGGMDDIERNPRAPSEFSIAVDENGEDILTDATVTFNWLHLEDDVTYEMVVTSKVIDPYALQEAYEKDTYNIGFLKAYNEFRNPAEDNKLHIDVKDSAFEAINLTTSANGHVIMPIRRNYLRPNRLYFFSLRSVRNRGLSDSNGDSIETISRWVTIPVTTHMVQAPAFIEAVKDMEIGFNIENTTIGANADDMELYYKKAGAGNTGYIRLNRGEFTCVQDGSTLYFRMYNLESNQWYDMAIKNKENNTWYDASSKNWGAVRGTPVKGKTRDALKEIEVRWEGEEPYKYFLEARTDDDSEYQQLYYSNTGHTDYGYDTPAGRIEYYRERTRLYVQEGSEKYIYYAKISGKPTKDENGILSKMPLKSNTIYNVKLWAYNLEESLHVGPVTARTDFSQSDYDEQKKEDDTIDLFNDFAEKLTQKLYWPIDTKDNTGVRVLLKDDRVAGLLNFSRGSTVTVDISTEKNNGSYYEVLIPYKTLEAIDKYNSSLNFRVLGGEFTLNKGSIDLSQLKAQTLTGVAKESMLLLKITRRRNPKNILPSSVKPISDAYELQTVGIGSSRTYGEINQMIYDILQNPEARGPFNYGILDRELTVVLNTLASYSYRNYIDLKDLINSIIGSVEIEMSKYLKDIIDGGSGISPSLLITKGINQFNEGVGVKLEYSYHNGYIAPFVNYNTAFREPSGGKGYLMQHVLFRVEGPGEFVVIGKGQAVKPPDMPEDNAITRLSSKYDLTKVFGQGTIYTANPIRGEEAIMLYAVVTGQDGKITGMTPVQKASNLGLGDLIDRSILTGYMDNQTSVSMAVKLYGTRANINPAYMSASKKVVIYNGEEIKPRLYSYVVLGVDLDIVKLDNKKFNASGRTTIGAMLDMISKALEKLD